MPYPAIILYYRDFAEAYREHSTLPIRIESQVCGCLGDLPRPLPPGCLDDPPRRLSPVTTPPVETGRCSEYAPALSCATVTPHVNPRSEGGGIHPYCRFYGQKLEIFAHLSKSIAEYTDIWGNLTIMKTLRHNRGPKCKPIWKTFDPEGRRRFSSQFGYSGAFQEKSTAIAFLLIIVLQLTTLVE